ncbi:MAG: hypothetical protein KW804_01905, partial [Candidatus Doudnabacteria bacterium]|nr:hypothetical protein [Candidatus Doudnabacteria bacterium]
MTKIIMRKFLILLLAVPFLAASCDLGGLFDFGGGGARGVFKSEDNGGTFNPFNNLEKKGDISNLAINTLVADQSNPDILFAGSSSGLHRTENGGKTWRYILAGINVSSIAVDKSNPSTIYAAGLVGQNGKIIKSLDNGTSWTDIYSEPSKSNTVLSIAISSVSPSTILAGLNNGELIRSTDSGNTWQATKDFADRVLNIKFGSSATAYALTSKNGLYKSTDLGVTWTSLTSSLTQDTINSLNKNAISITAFYELALDIRQNGVIYLGTEQGLFRSVNDGKDWAFMSMPVRNAALRVSAISVNPQNSNNLFVSV